MAEMLSPGVFVTEIDASTIVPTVSNSIAIYGGKFVKGPIGQYTLITSVDDLISYYGEPTDTNYNDFYQAYNFLQYGNKLLVSRAANVGGSTTAIDGALVTTEISTPLSTEVIGLDSVVGLAVGNFITFGIEDDVYQIVSVDDITPAITLDRQNVSTLAAGVGVNLWSQDVNGVAEVLEADSTVSITPDDYVKTMMVIENASDFEMKETAIAFTSTDTKVKIIAKSPGAWSEDLEIAIARPDAFGENFVVTVDDTTDLVIGEEDVIKIINSTTFISNKEPIVGDTYTGGATVAGVATGEYTQAFDGIMLDDLYEYTPSGTEIGIMIKMGDEIKEVFTVDFDETARDYNNKSTYIETVINNQSNYIFIKDNTTSDKMIDNKVHAIGGVTTGVLMLELATDSEIQADDLLNAYEVFDNKEELDIDIVIGNELDAGVSAKNLVETRKDCIAFIGANYADTVGHKSATVITKLTDWRKKGSINYNNMFVVACGNYKYQYDRYADKYRWVNIAGDIAGLRAQTSMNRASWWASAGLERGQIKNVTKLAFNPTQGQRDLLYKNGINPICSFPGQGTVMWGQKTLLSKPSSFDRVNVRGLFNTMERALSKMAKYQVMEFNDNFTRNRIVSMVKPYLSSVQAGRGIQDFLVICDESNNTPDVISRNQLVVDIYIKPTYVAEFIQLRFTNAGTNSFSEVIGG